MVDPSYSFRSSMGTLPDKPRRILMQIKFVSRLVSANRDYKQTRRRLPGFAAGRAL
jgi:hypothetical protein